jgi:RNA polymerase sigma-70 factor (ECF subfamily)
VPSEEELIERSQRGDREAFSQLIHQYQDRIYLLARKVCAQAPQEAEGVHQETFVTALEKIQQFENRSALGTWLYRIAANLCFMRLRAKRRSVTQPLEFDDLLEDPAPDPASAAARAELQGAVEKALESLPTDYRLVVTLRDIQGLSAEETSKILKLSIPAVKSRLHRGRVYLREKLLLFKPAASTA